MRNFSALFIALTLMVGAFAACGSTETPTTEPAVETDTAAVEASKQEGATDETITIVHELGTTEVPLNPEKVVVMDFGMLDTIDLLGATPELAIPANNIPAYLSKYETTALNIGGLKEYDMEAIVSFEPDLIILGGRQQDAYSEFSKIAPTVYLSSDNARYLDSAMENIDKIGQIFQKEDKATELIASFNTTMEQIKTVSGEGDHSTLILLTNEGGMSVYGSGSRFGIIHDSFGFPVADDAIEASTHGQEINYEYISEKNPDYIFVVDRTVAVGGEEPAAETLNNDLVNGTKAAQNGNIIQLSPDIWYLSGGGIQSLTLMADEIWTAIQ